MTLFPNIAYSLTEPPHTVDPINGWSILGHGIMLLMGLLTLAGSGATKDRTLAKVGLVALGGFSSCWYAETRYFRAIHPDSVALFRWTAAGLLLLTAVTAYAAWALLKDTLITVLVAGGGTTALLCAITADHFYERLAAVPLALFTVVAIALGFVLWLRHSER